MQINKFLFLNIVLLNTCFVHCVLEPLTWAGITASAGIAIKLGINYFYPKCTSTNYVKKNTTNLEQNLNEHLHGQHIAKEIILKAIDKHWQNPNPIKPLVMILHGPVGTGKNYVSRMIANAMFNDGESSDFYHFFNGRISFPNVNNISHYQNALIKEVTTALETCENALFVFDEVDDMAEGVLNILVPFWDYNKHGPLSKRINKNKSIYLLLSNTASNIVVDKMLEHWKKGYKRENLAIKDFEKDIVKGIFNQKGGLKGSDTISTSLIDHYIPFLPLEHEHIEQCIRQAYKRHHNKEPNDDTIRDIMSRLSFGPKDYDVYSESGCKRIESAVLFH